MLTFQRTINLKIPLESGTFQDCAAKRFNSLPAAVKSCPDFNTFPKETHKILKAAIDISRDAHADIIISNSDVCTVPSNE